MLVKHPFNGKRLSQCQLNDWLTAIIQIPLNPVWAPLDTDGAPVRPLQQVTLRPDRFSAEGYIRLGTTPGDEANCWIHPHDIRIVEVLGKASLNEDGELVIEETQPIAAVAA